MENKNIISKENARDYILSQIEVVKTSATSFGFKFLSSYLDLAEQVLDEELLINNSSVSKW